VADELAAKVKARLDSSPELKQTLEELQRDTAGLADRCVWQRGSQDVGTGPVAPPQRARVALTSACGVLLPTLWTRSARQESAQLLRQGREIFSALKGSLPGNSGHAGGQQAGDTGGSRQQQVPLDPQAVPKRSLVSRAKELAVQAARSVDHAVRAELRLAVMDSSEAAAERARERAAQLPRLNRDVTAMSVVQPKPQGGWQKRWGHLSSFATPLFTRLGAVASQAGSTAVVRKTRDLADEVRDRWETSDSALVHKLQDLGDSMRMQETAAARAMATILEREPGFDMHTFVALVRRDVPKVLAAYLQADLAALQAAGLAEPLLERLSAMTRTWTAEKLTMDSTVLDVSDPEVVEVKLVEGAPLVVLQFQVQQINCVRSMDGQVKEGAPDDVQSVYYAWAMEQVLPAPDADDATPQWRLRDLMVRGMHAIT
jgi:import inner membrane translocase subunit TIM44